MKYYVYISDAKVDMLLAQIPHEAKQRLATEFKFDLKLLSASRKSETESEDNRFSRLEAVVTFIREYGNLGTVDEPDDYVEDSLEMRWGPYGMGDEKEPPLIYFGGVTDRTIIGLGGSIKHVIGNSGVTHTHSHSATPMLLARLERELKLDEQAMSPPDDAGNTEVSGDWSLRAVELATTEVKGPKQWLEFMAKRLLFGRGYSKKKKVLLATPLYVALLE